MRFAVCFCAHAGELETKALLLAVSLRRHWPSTVELIACFPQDPTHAGITNGCQNAFESLGVRSISVSNPISTDYPIGNKLLCLDVKTDADRVIFLDSDIVALSVVTEKDLETVFGAGMVAKPADLATFGIDGAQWQALYKKCGAEIPKHTVTATVTGETMPPYFNAGVIGVDANSDFGEAWADCASIIDALHDLPTRRPHLDQIALPIAATKRGLPINVLGEDWNYPAHLRPAPEAMPKLCHYHWPEVIEREPAVLDAIGELATYAPAISAAMRREPKWHRVAQKACLTSLRSRKKRFPEGIITGIPRSGTSYLCHLIDLLPGHVVINEPAEIFAPLNRPAPGLGVACYYRDLRRRILDGEPVENKTDAGRIIEDTAKMDVRTAAPISVQEDDFTLWTKNTLAYLNRLPQLLEAMPDATFVACVRHPVDTIESWARTFPHLRDADVEKFPVGSPADPLLSPTQRGKLSAVADCTDLPRRRAMLWNYLATLILKHRDRLVIVRLEDLADNPDAKVHELSTGRSKRDLTEALWQKKVASKTASSEVSAHVLSECGANASLLGYLVDE